MEKLKELMLKYPCTGEEFLGIELVGDYIIVSRCTEVDWGGVFKEELERIKI